MKTKLTPSDYAVIVQGYENAMEEMSDNELQEFYERMKRSYNAGVLDEHIFSSIEMYYEANIEYEEGIFDEAQREYDEDAKHSIGWYDMLIDQRME